MKESELRAKLKIVRYELTSVSEQVMDEIVQDHLSYIQRKDNAYLERNKLVALLAELFPSGIAKTNIPGWNEEWHNCVYIDLPTGQVSWHYHISHSSLFQHLPPYEGAWDGHTTETKYERVAAMKGYIIKGMIEL